MMDTYTVMQVDGLGGDQFLGHVDLIVNGRAYGGQILAQALSSAVKTVEDPNFLIQSVHCYFHSLVKREDVIYHVARLKDGRSISTRKVRATQGEKTVFSCLVSLSVEEKEDIGLTHTDHMMPQVDPPSSDTVRSEMPSLVSQPVCSNDKPLNRLAYLWMRTVQSGPQEKNMQRISLAYASDCNLALVVNSRHVCTVPVSGLSLDHSIWFHENVDFNQWHLFVQECVCSTREKPLNIARVYSQSGDLVATVMQQSLITAKL